MQAKLEIRNLSLELRRDRRMGLRLAQLAVKNDNCSDLDRVLSRLPQAFDDLELDRLLQLARRWKSERSVEALERKVPRSAPVSARATEWANELTERRDSIAHQSPGFANGGLSI